MSGTNSVIGARQQGVTMTCSIADFYNTLFSIEIAVFGIIAAAVFVLTQMVHADLSYKGVSVLFRPKFALIPVAIGSLTLLFTATGSLLLSFPSFDFIPQINLGTRLLFSSGYAALAALALFILSVAGFFLLVVKNATYLRPSRMALLIGTTIRPD